MASADSLPAQLKKCKKQSPQNTKCERNKFLGYIILHYFRQGEAGWDYIIDEHLYVIVIQELNKKILLVIHYNSTLATVGCFIYDVFWEKNKLRRNCE